MTVGRADLRRDRYLRWSIERAQKKRGNRRRYHPEKSASFFAYPCRRVKEDRGMQSVVGIALLVVGVVLSIFGMQASASLGSRLSELFTGAPSDRTIWLVVAGVAAAIVGLGLLLAGRRRTL
jgi:LPXTG-motif cell wall-anchored protein